MSDRLRIIFVDDEPSVLQGLRRMLRKKRTDWEMLFFSKPTEALEEVQRCPPDIVVADMRMPVLNGGQLLEAVRKDHPEVLRLILSGYSDVEHSLQTVGVAHQFLIKPCSPEILQATISRIAQLEALMKDRKLLRVIAGIKHLPGLPTLYLRLSKELATNDPDIESVIRQIQTDAALTAKILQMVNSGFFGLPRSLSDVSEASKILGVQTLHSIVLFSGIYDQAAAQRSLPFSHEDFAFHALEVGNLAGEIGRMLNLPPPTQKEAFTAGLLHDVGKLIFSLYRPKVYERTLEEAKKRGLKLSQRERSVFGVDHGHVGSYLLHLWGMPGTLVEAVAHHSRPSQSAHHELGSLAAVHIADTLARTQPSDNRPLSLDDFDPEFMENIQMAKKLPALANLYKEFSKT